MEILSNLLHFFCLPSKRNVNKCLKGASGEREYLYCTFNRECLTESWVPWAQIPAHLWSSYLRQENLLQLQFPTPKLSWPHNKTQDEPYRWSGGSIWSKPDSHHQRLWASLTFSPMMFLTMSISFLTSKEMVAIHLNGVSATEHGDQLTIRTRCSFPPRLMMMIHTQELCYTQAISTSTQTHTSS